jgi:hypothetical protein
MIRFWSGQTRVNRVFFYFNINRSRFWDLWISDRVSPDFKIMNLKSDLKKNLS